MEESTIVLPLRVIDHGSLAAFTTFALLAAGLAWAGWRARLGSAWLGALLFGMTALSHGWVVLAGLVPALGHPWPGEAGEPHAWRMMLPWAVVWLPALSGALATVFVLHGLCSSAGQRRGTSA